MKWIFICLVFLNYKPLVASEIVWLKLSPLFEYADLFTSCSNDTASSILYFGFEIEGNKAIASTIKTNNHPYLYEAISFFQDELQEIEFYEDKYGKKWLKNLPLSERVLIWISGKAGKFMDTCVPSMTLANTNPKKLYFLFDTHLLGETFLTSTSGVFKYKGKRIDGNSYQAKLGWIQTR